MRTLAMYLPQYHEIIENDLWWGKGYTEWSSVKKAKPLFNGHYEPHVPLNENYYDLSNPNADTWKWQSLLAKQYGIYGFCIYHYWFDNGHQLLERPSEILLKHSEIDTHYCFCWANESWTKTWYGLENSLLMKQEYGDKNERRRHFEYLLHFFNDKRYIKVNNKPVLCIYKTKLMPYITDLISEWNSYAKKAGFNGIFFIAANTNIIDDRQIYDAFYDFEPTFSLKNHLSIFDSLAYYSNASLRYIENSIFKTKLLEKRINSKMIYRQIVKRAKENSRINKSSSCPIYSSIFPSWDNTPRRNYLGAAYVNTSPKVFGKCLKAIYPFVRNDEFFFINAWNEWGEGCHLEPDEKWKFGYLEMVRDSLCD